MQDSVNLRIPPRLLEVGVSCLEMMKLIKNYFILPSVLIIHASLSTTTRFYAITQVMTESVSKASNSFLKELANIYCGSLWLLFLAINVIWLAVTKNDKIVGLLWKTLIAIFIAYIFFDAVVRDADSSILKNLVANLNRWFNHKYFFDSPNEIQMLTK